MNGLPLALSSTDLSNADLSDAIFLNADLRKTKNLTQAQLEGKKQPLICNSPLPQSINIDLNRDCDKVAAVLPQRKTLVFRTLKEAIKHVKEQQKIKWDNTNQ